MTALPNMPTREEVEEALRICDASSIDGQFHKVEIFPLIAAARAYLMLDAAHKGNVNTIEHFTNLLNEEKSKRLAAEERVRKMAMALQAVLPVAKGFAEEHDVGNNLVNEATEALEQAKEMGLV